MYNIKQPNEINVLAGVSPLDNAVEYRVNIIPAGHLTVT
jgi:hypothetical protein